MKECGLSFKFDNTYARELEGFYTQAIPARVPTPRVLFFNAPLAEALGLTGDASDADALAQCLSGNALPEGASPIAQAYAGHQFGHFSPQLGDGRAVLLGEVIDTRGVRQDIALKGSGRTSFSRTGDGKAAVGPMLREVLISEAMQALGIPTTRSLGVVATGEPVYREDVLPGAVLTRIASSHIRVGTFEYFAARGDMGRVQQLADYTIARHDPHLTGQPDRYLQFLRAVAERQAALIARWMNVGFIHGVMNTDNMALSGETIDYGPCAFLEAYDPATVFSSIDRQGRYAYGRQPMIAQWNLARLAETLLPLIDSDEQKAIAMATGVLDEFPDRYQHHWLSAVRAKLGIMNAPASADPTDIQLALDWLTLLQQNKVDFTQAWRYLGDAAANRPSRLNALFTDTAGLDAWLDRWQQRCREDDQRASTEINEERHTQRAAAMNQVNPRIIPRNHRVEEALMAATADNDLAPFEALLAAVRRPFDDSDALARYAEPAPAAVTACYKTFCGT